MSPATTPEWERRCTALREGFDDHSPAEFRAAVDALTAELPDGRPAALIERASALDATDRDKEAVALCERALALHLPEYGRSVAEYAAAAGRTDTGHGTADTAAP
ncbi:tetratricopeptide repeat protein [Streptomyces sp. P38-E01]|uniref:Tetratricopeptide repeat protein n=1 Tax=Streptomyces tardus TaxID=2780544 RepID=A0A949N819_9ACTN|nr:tetratricopeptide repeat protein [Streptomyces tardus]MBU7598071.1 tetratricopeptide repeat protein [Streptomyces tardus]